MPSLLEAQRLLLLRLRDSSDVPVQPQLCWPVFRGALSSGSGEGTRSETCPSLLISVCFFLM